MGGHHDDGLFRYKRHSSPDVAWPDAACAFSAAAIGLATFAVALYAARERLQLGGLLAIMRLRPVRLESTDQRAARARSMQ